MHSPKLHPDPCNSAGMRAVDRHTDARDHNTFRIIYDVIIEKSSDSHKNPTQAYMRIVNVPKRTVCNCKQIHIAADDVNL